MIVKRCILRLHLKHAQDGAWRRLVGREFHNFGVFGKSLNRTLDPSILEELKACINISNLDLDRYLWIGLILCKCM